MFWMLRVPEFETTPWELSCSAELRQLAKEGWHMYISICLCNMRTYTLTYVIYVYHMYIICISYVYHMYIICIQNCLDMWCQGPYRCMHMHLQIFYACRDLHRTGNRSLSQSPGGISLCLCSAHSPGIGQFGLVASPPFGIPLQFQNGWIPTKEAMLVDGKCMLDLKYPK